MTLLKNDKSGKQGLILIIVINHCFISYVHYLKSVLLWKEKCYAKNGEDVVKEMPGNRTSFIWCQKYWKLIPSDLL